MYKLCYAEGDVSGLFYFTDNYTKQWGDDWNDAPYSSNAGAPYKRDDSRDEEWNANCGHLRVLGYLNENWEVKSLHGACYSVEAINTMRMPWLFNEEKHTGIQGGDSMPKVIRWCRENGVKVGELR